MAQATQRDEVRCARDEFHARLSTMARDTERHAEALRDVCDAIETTGRITYKGRTYLIVDELTGLPSHLVEPQ